MSALEFSGRPRPAEGEMERELFAAIRAKNKERPRQLLEMGADVNAYEPAEICRDEKDPCICIAESRTD